MFAVRQFDEIEEIECYMKNHSKYEKLHGIEYSEAHNGELAVDAYKVK